MVPFSTLAARHALQAVCATRLLLTPTAESSCYEPAPRALPSWAGLVESPEMYIKLSSAVFGTGSVWTCCKDAASGNVLTDFCTAEPVGHLTLRERSDEPLRFAGPRSEPYLSMHVWDTSLHAEDAAM